MVTAINAPVAVAPPPAPAAPASPTAALGAFSRELDRAAQAGDPEAEATEEAQAPSAQAPGGPARAKAKPDSKTAERKPEQATVHGQDRVTESATERSKDKAGSDDGNPPTDLQALLAGLMAHAPTPPSTTPASAAAARTTARLEAAEAGQAGSAPEGGGQATGLPAPAIAQAAQPLAADAAAAAATAALPSFSLAQAVNAPPPPTEAAPPAPVHQAQVSAAVGTPEFAPGLSAEVNVMLRDGLQEARLQLNPAEMGPITVQIQIEGSNAQIHLSAEQAPTRDALEQALPTLAGTLRDSGLTLTGGGVFEQPRQPRDDTPQRGGRAGRSGSDADAGSPVAGLGGGARQLAPRGVVDLYA